MNEEEMFLKAGNSVVGSEQSQMLGKPCFKIQGNAFCCLFQNCIVFKLDGDMHKTASALKGSVLFDPSGKGRAMKEWVQVPSAYSKKWVEFAKKAAEFVRKGK